MGKRNTRDLGPNINIKSLDSAFFQEELSAGGLWDSEIKAFMDNLTLKSLFYSEDWVFIVLDLLASEISNVDMRVFKETIVKGEKQIEPDESHPLNTLIQNPNPWMTYSTWMYLHVIEYCLMGNGIQWYSESLNQLNIIPAENVSLDIDKATGELKKYIVTNHMDDQVAVQTFSPDVILHQRRPNPLSKQWGMSPFIPNRKSILFNKYSQDYLNSFYLKQATGQLALKLDKQINEKSALRLMRSFEVSYTGRKNQRRTMLLPQGVDIKEISQSIADQNLIEIIDKNQEKIINILRIPKHALSLAKTGSLGSEEHKMALRFLWTSAIVPVMKKISESFTNFFSEQLGPDRALRFDLSTVEILREDHLRTAELSIKQLNFMTLNEVRKLSKLPPLPGGDVIVSLAPAGDTTPGPKPEARSIDFDAISEDAHVELTDVIDDFLVSQAEITVEEVMKDNTQQKRLLRGKIRKKSKSQVTSFYRRYYTALLEQSDAGYQSVKDIVREEKSNQVKKQITPTMMPEIFYDTAFDLFVVLGEVCENRVADIVTSFKHENNAIIAKKILTEFKLILQEKTVAELIQRHVSEAFVLGKRHGLNTFANLGEQ